MNSHYMTRLSRQLVIILALLLGWQMEAKADGQRQEDKLVAIEPVHERQQGAILSDGQYLYRLCNSRPQRLTHSFSPPPTTGKGCDPGANVPAPHYSLILYSDCLGKTRESLGTHYLVGLTHVIHLFNNQ